MNEDEKNIRDENYTMRIDGTLEDLELAEKKDLERATQEHQHVDNIIPWVIEFRVIGTPEIIRAPIGSRLLMGRKDENNNILPEINLAPFNGQGLGVSRRHARIIMRDNRITIEDLGSANGTYINGRHIGILTPTRVQDGDQIKLGNLSLQAHFVVQPSTNDDTLHGFEDNLDIPKIGNKQRILILDDNQEVCAVIRMIALKAGFKVAVAHDTQQAVHYWDEGDIEGIIVELMLEDSNGLDLVDYVRQNSNKHIPIIATTSTAGGYRENQALAKGVDEIVEKPLSIDSIVASLGKLT